MFRFIISVVKWLLLVAGVMWASLKLSKNTTTLPFNVGGYAGEAPLWTVVIGLIVFAAVSIMLYSLYKGLINGPRRLREKSSVKRKESGYEALSTGMVALAAGDADEAKAAAAKADRLLKSPPITNLLAAQSAQLKGDEKSARRFFAEMLKEDETKFLGLRGLINQGLRDGRTEEALLLAREAHKMRPESKWVLESLFELETRSGNMLEAQKVVREQRNLSYINSEDSRKKQSILMIEQSKNELDNLSVEEAVKSARQAAKLDPKNTAGAIVKAKALLAANKQNEAASAIEKAWSNGPQENMVTMYLEARAANTEEARAGAIRSLAKSNRKASLSNILLAELAIKDQKWDQAQSFLVKAEEAGPSERGYKLMAQVEQAMSNDTDKVREHLMKAIDAKGEGQWTCASCGTTADEWSARCGSCNSFGEIAWKENEGRKSAEALIQPSAPLLPKEEVEEGKLIEGVAETANEALPKPDAQKA